MLVRYYRYSIVEDCFNQIIPNEDLEKRNKTTKEIVFVDEDNGFVVGQIRPMPSDEELEKYKGLINGYIEKTENRPIAGRKGNGDPIYYANNEEALQEEIACLKGDIINANMAKSQAEERIAKLEETLREKSKLIAWHEGFETGVHVVLAESKSEK